jgi:hypothetical protein
VMEVGERTAGVGPSVVRVEGRVRVGSADSLGLEHATQAPVFAPRVDPLACPTPHAILTPNIPSG